MLWRSFCYGSYFDPFPATEGWLLRGAFLALCSLDQTARLLLAAANPLRPWPKQVRDFSGKCTPPTTTHHFQAPGETATFHQDPSRAAPLVGTAQSDMDKSPHHDAKSGARSSAITRRISGPVTSCR